MIRHLPELLGGVSNGVPRANICSKSGFQSSHFGGFHVLDHLCLWENISDQANLQ